MALLSVLLLLGALVFLLALHLWIAGSAHRRRLRPWLAQPGRGLSQAELQKLPCVEFEVGGSSCTDSSCAVCLEEFEKSGGEKCKILPACNHTFHAKCLDAWLSKTPTCPICRTTAGDRRESGHSCALVPISCNRGVVITPTLFSKTAQEIQHSPLQTQLRESNLKNGIWVKDPNSNTMKRFRATPKPTNYC